MITRKKADYPAHYHHEVIIIMTLIIIISTCHLEIVFEPERVIQSLVRDTFYLLARLVLA